MNHRVGLVLAVALGMVVGAGTVAVAAPGDPCDAVYSADSVASWKAYDECRFDRIEAKLDAMATTAPTPEPSSTEPTPEPTSAEPTPEPSSTEPSPEPSSIEPTPEPSSVEPTPSPEPTSPAPEPTPSSPGGIVILGRSFPNAATTGVPDAIKPSLTPYTGSCTITASNVKIDRKIINCDMRLLGPGIAITNSVVNGTLYSDCCYLNGAFTVTDSEIHGPNSAATVVGEARFTLLRVEITGGSRSVNCNLNCTVQDSYIHGQYDDTRGIDHESGIRQDQGGNIIHNTITCDAKPYPPDSGCSAAISGYGDFGTVQNNIIDNNLIDGGPAGSMSYCIYGGSTQGKPYPNANHIVVTNNIFRRGPNGKCGIYGPVTSFDSAAPGNVWTNNVWDNDGKPVPPAN